MSSASVGGVVAELRRCLDGLLTAGRELSAAGTIGEHLPAGSEAMELTAITARVGEFLERLDAGAGSATELASQVETVIEQASALSGSVATGPAASGSSTDTAAAAGATSSDRPFGPLDPLLRGPLGTAFRAGVHDPEQRFLAKERAIADFLAAGGSSVHALPADHTRSGVKNPDAVVRRSGQDTGRITEFKTLDRATSSAVKRNILTASKKRDQRATPSSWTRGEPVRGGSAGRLRAPLARPANAAKSCPAVF